MTEKVELYTSGPRRDAMIFAGSIRALFEILYPGYGRKIMADSLEEHKEFVTGGKHSPATMAQMTMAKHDKDLTEAQPTLFKITIECLNEELK